MITEVNDAFCALFGRDRDQIVGHWPHEFTVSADRGRLTPFEDMRNGRCPERFQTRKRYRRGDGQIRWVDVHVRLVHDHAGHPGYFLAHVQDITGWVTAQHEAHQAETQYRDLFNRVMLSIGTALELRDPYTAGHQRRVAELSPAISDHLGLDNEIRQGLTVGVGLHDMGKVSTPAEILTKPGRLDGAEYATMVLQTPRTPRRFGLPRRPARRCEQPRSPGPRCRRRRRDHRLHPPLPPRRAAPLETALQVISDGQGTLFDSDPVDACIGVFDAGFAFTASA